MEQASSKLDDSHKVAIYLVSSFNSYCFGQLSILGKIHLKNLEISVQEPPNKKQKTTEGNNVLSAFSKLKVEAQWCRS